MPHSLQAGEPDPLEKIEIRGKRYQHPNPNHQSYKGYYTGTGTIPTNHNNDEPSSGGGSKSTDKDKKDCELKADAQLKICNATHRRNYHDTLESKCNFQASSTIGADGIVIKASLTIDEYTQCVNLAVAKRDRDLAYCAVDKAITLSEECHQ
ncbi:hypothetical protein [Litorilituus sediminis]|uniref:Uncharacterized protein n=1 Tax=Litorilituus sediminis TaxID=718192 RepID=A0A4P6P3R9_9GAMM|nr:hypothetical protein [Litorilituus sediminis]QBG35983.1 hypothetical protein EMK97_09790 [Litorilituus sediminis]